MTKLEKQMIGAVVAFIVAAVVLAHSVSSLIEQTGGVKGIAVEVGKAVKDVANEIEKYEPAP